MDSPSATMAASSLSQEPARRSKTSCASPSGLTAEQAKSAELIKALRTRWLACHSGDLPICSPKETFSLPRSSSQVSGLLEPSLANCQEELSDVCLALPRSPTQASEPFAPSQLDGNEEEQQLLPSTAGNASGGSSGSSSSASSGSSSRSGRASAHAPRMAAMPSCDLWGLFIKSFQDAYDGTLSLIGGLCPPSSSQVANERLRMRLEICGLEERWVAADGNCFYSSTSDQLYGTPRHHLEIREATAKELKKNPMHYKGFWAESDELFWRMIESHAIPGTWADELSMAAMANAYGATIMMVSSRPGEDFLEKIVPGKQRSQRVLWLSHLHDTHFNSLYRKGECPVDYSLC